MDLYPIFPRTKVDPASALEEKKADMPSRASFTNIQAKENIAPTNARTQKRKADVDKFTTAKRGRQG
ncbi:hypothetical protein PAXRUDRAFT_20231 [Paxillus rubicundulus Ve08.2h10]|uniref:Uncharacterized protein n=1 Tax=Paxillus rubicundulus Ve08.2h10 TaxID=930991 RepID=A0A0D0CSX5_9AGAM|nr:hypothetical protein PAXRUDRAFT_20231 [Paxillus rubicundulus Ve08.2h10]